MSFNPVYGQGMTVGVLGAMELKRCFASRAETHANGQDMMCGLPQVGSEYLSPDSVVLMPKSDQPVTDRDTLW